MYGRTSADLFKSGAKMIASGTAVFGIYSLTVGNERFYRELIMPCARAVTDGESAHGITIAFSRYVPARVWGSRNCPEDCTKLLSTEVFGIPFENAVGLAAGFDKNCEAAGVLSARSGFGFIEIGSVTPLPQDGNAKPRVFRLPEDEAVINRYGFNSIGYDAFYGNLQRELKDKTSPCIVGVNLGKNKDDRDFVKGYRDGYLRFSRDADYIVVNLSSPNTPGLRNLQNRAELTSILSSLREAKQTLAKTPKLLIKISPDLTDDDLATVCSVVVANSNIVDGLVVTNTTISRPSTLKSQNAIETGGLSGKPLRELSTACIKRAYILTNGKVPIIGCGGISSGEDAYQKIRAGASLVQLYTAMVYDGFPVVGKVKRELADCLRRDGFENIQAAVGIDSRQSDFSVGM